MAVQITVEGQAPKYLTAPTYTLGRAEECDVRLPENDRLVSRHHARLERDEGEMWWLVDLSTNGTFVNGERMSGRRALQDSDQIGIGRSQIAFANRVPAPAPAVPDESPARNAQTVFVTGEMRASAREAASRSQAPLATPIASPRAAQAAPPSSATSPSPQPPASPQPIEVPLGATVVASSPAATPAPIGARAARSSEVGAPTRVILAPPKAQDAVAAVAAARPSTESQSVPLTDSAPLARNGIPKPGQDGAARGPKEAVVGSAEGAERMKQCSGCGHLYAPEQNDCPDCGSSAFSIRGAAPATILVTRPEPESVAAPKSTAASVGASASGVTPFDMLARGGELAPSNPSKAPNGVAPRESALNGGASNGVVLNGAAPGLATDVAHVPSIPAVPQSEAGARGQLPEGVTFGLPAEPNSKPTLRLAGMACGLSMLVSLFLPWALANLGGHSYARLCSTALEGIGQGERGGLVLMLPVLATLAVIGASSMISTAGRSHSRGSSLALALGGALGLLGAGALRVDPWGLSGPGLWLFAGAALGAALVGLIRLFVLARR